MVFYILRAPLNCVKFDPPKFSASRKRGLQGEVAEAELRQSLRSLQTHAQPAQSSDGLVRWQAPQGAWTTPGTKKKRHRRHVDIASLSNISKPSLNNPKKYVCTSYGIDTVSFLGSPVSSAITPVTRVAICQQWPSTHGSAGRTHPCLAYPSDGCFSTDDSPIQTCAECAALIRVL